MEEQNPLVKVGLPSLMPYDVNLLLHFGSIRVLEALKHFKKMKHTWSIIPKAEWAAAFRHEIVSWGPSR